MLIFSLKKILCLLILAIAGIAFGQTKLTHSTDEDIWPSNIAACTTTGPGTIENNSFIRVFDTNDFNVVDSVFFVRIEFGVESTTGGTYELIGRLHKLNGLLLFTNMTLLAADTAGIYPDSSIYKMNIPIKDGFAIPGDTVITEVFAGLNALVTFFPGTNPYLESNPSYIASSACGITEPTAYSSVGYPTAHLVMNLWVNHKPTMTDMSLFIFKDNVLNLTKNDFSIALSDFDNDTINMIQILSLPANGILENNSVALMIGDTVWSNELELLTYSPDVSFVGSDNFNFRVRDNSHWSNDSIKANFTISDWQLVFDEDVLLDFEIFPNPATTSIEIKSSTKNLEIGLYDIDGRLLISEKHSSNSIDVSKLTNGIYLVVVTTEKGPTVQQFIKQ